MNGIARRLLIVSNLFPPAVVGGAEIVACRQARQMAKTGWVVAVFAGGFADSEREAGSIDLEFVDDVPIHRIAHRSFAAEANFRWPTAEARFLSVLETHRPEIVHFHNVTGLGASLIPLAKRHGVMTVVTLHDHWGFCFKNTMLRNDERLCGDVEDCAQCLPRLQGSELPIRLRRDYVAWCVDQADLLLSPSTYLADAYRRSGAVRQPARVLSNGIDLDAVPVALKTPGPVVKFVAFGYLGRHKGIESLIEAARRLAAVDDLTGQWELTLAGHGYLLSAVEAAIADPALRGLVRYVGQQSHHDALRLMAEADAVILASIWPENEPVTLLEAVASGTAQIASRIGGNGELVVDGQSGLLFPPGDVNALAAIMEKAVRDPGLLHAMGAFNAGRRERFDEKATVAQLQQLFQDLQPRSGRGDEVIVLCEGSHPPPPEVQLAIHRFHLASDGVRPIRLIWHEWATADMWTTAHLLWIWDRDRPLTETRAATALRSGIRTLCPRSLTGLPLGVRSEALIPYDTVIEAIGIMAAIGDADLGGDDPKPMLQSLARRVNASATASTFFLPVGA